MVLLFLAQAFPAGAAAGQQTHAAPKPASLTSAPSGTHRLVSQGGAGGNVARLLGTGFRVKPGTSEVVIQTSAEVTLEARSTPAGSVFVLKNCRIFRNNDRRPLDTRFFDSAITGITLKEHGPDLEISVTVRGTSVATPHKERGPGASWYWILEFPRRDAIPRSDTAPTTKSSKTTTAAAPR